MDNIVDVDVGEDEVAELMENETVNTGGVDSTLAEVMTDIQTAHGKLDEFKQGSLSLAQNLSDASEETDDDALEAVLTDMSDGAFAVYLRLHRGDEELMGERAGEHSGLLAE